MRDNGTIPKPLTCQELKKLLIDALKNEPDHCNPETYHARFDHLERGLQFDDVVYDRVEGLPASSL